LNCPDENAEDKKRLFCKRRIAGDDFQSDAVCEKQLYRESIFLKSAEILHTVKCGSAAIEGTDAALFL